MIHSKNLIANSIHPVSLAKRMLLGAGIGLALVSLFLIGSRAEPAWGKLWMIRPLIMVPLAGAGAGLINYMMDDFRAQGGWKKALAIAFTVVAYIIALWLGIVLGLDGTLWD
ncbi:potassium transporter KefB [Pedobacter polaris]|uniref:Potassium transporter KefB n=1 Tax=Pedobacter polaris TaxID=2571273 RepID=A0A4U1CXN2_9SPHI|nr:potassium transporter KefB [Pedobacter polaris]TKC13170.1 potassium transporter KefB [Pedobacter polaris]